LNPERRFPELSGAELELMKVLWRAGRLSAREVHEQVADELGWAYSTTRTTLDRMAKKGVVTKKPFHGLHLYEPSISKARGLAARVREFAERVLEIDPAPVVSLFAESEALTDEEMEELSRLLREPAAGKAREGEP
jgi:BlaI family penicillinase repressor